MIEDDEANLVVLGKVRGVRSRPCAATTSFHSVKRKLRALKTAHAMKAPISQKLEPSAKAVRFTPLQVITRQ